MQTANDFILQIRDLSKQYGGVKALNRVNLNVKYGEVHALVGENGAGKSTLIKILGGMIQRDAGKIVFRGKEIDFKNPHESQSSGIAVIHQEPAMLPHLSIMENIYMGRMPRKLGLVDWSKLRGDTKETTRLVGLEKAPDTLVQNLNTAHRQLVDIAKALTIKASLIIMDEPNSSLAELETVKLFEVIRTLKAKGVCIIYVSHKIEEVLMISDSISVLRDGSYVGLLEKKQASAEAIIQMAVGRDIKKSRLNTFDSKGEVLLEVRRLQGSGFTDISFKVRKAEVVGFAGLIGAGRSELARAIFGADRFTGGEVLLEGRSVRFKSESDAIRNGVAMLPEDRILQSTFPGMQILHNMSISSLSRLTRLGIISDRLERKLGERFARTLLIRLTSLQDRIAGLSGGNQQKAILARWLATDPKVLILDEPTHGIDVGAKEEIYRLIQDISKRGIGVILVSSELPEIIALSHRIVVMREGKITGLLDNTTTVDQETIMRYATGVANDFKQ